MYSIFPWFLSYLGLIYIGIGVAYNADKDCGKGQYKSDFLSGGCAKCPKLLKQCEDQEIDDARRCFIACMLWNCTKPNASCPSGTFKSDFLSGGCALCPQKLKACENEELEDSVRCFKACQRRFSTIQPFLSSTAAPQVQISFMVLLDTTSTTKSPKIKKTNATQQVPDKLSSKKDYDRFMLPTSSHASKEQTGDRDGTSILTFGVVLSSVALLLVIAGCFALYWWKGRGNKATEVHEPKYTFNAAPLGTINSEQSTSDAISSNIDDVAIDVDIEPSSLRSSCEDFQKLPQTEV